MGHPAHIGALGAGARRDGYARRKPEASALHQVVRENVLTLYAAIEQGFASPLPKFVRDELEGLRLNPHYHAVFLDGVFAAGEDGVVAGEGDGALRFHPLPSLSSGEVADLMQTVRVRVVGWLQRHGVITSFVRRWFRCGPPRLRLRSSSPTSTATPRSPRRIAVSIGRGPGCSRDPST